GRRARAEVARGHLAVSSRDRRARTPTSSAARACDDTGFFDTWSLRDRGDDRDGSAAVAARSSAGGGKTCRFRALRTAYPPCPSLAAHDNRFRQRPPASSAWLSAS